MNKQQNLGHKKIWNMDQFEESKQRVNKLQNQGHNSSFTIPGRAIKKAIKGGENGGHKTRRRPSSSSSSA